MLHFLIIGLVNGIQQKFKVENLIVTSLQLNKDVPYLVIVLTLDPLMYLSICRLPVKQNFPGGTKESQSKSPVLPPVSPTSA